MSNRNFSDYLIEEDIEQLIDNNYLSEAKIRDIFTTIIGKVKGVLVDETNANSVKNFLMSVRNSDADVQVKKFFKKILVDIISNPRTFSLLVDVVSSKSKDDLVNTLKTSGRQYGIELVKSQIDQVYEILNSNTDKVPTDVKEVAAGQITEPAVEDKPKSNLQVKIPPSIGTRVKRNF